MAERKHEVPPVPLPPAGGAIPPVEPTPPVPAVAVPTAAQAPAQAPAQAAPAAAQPPSPYAPPQAQQAHYAAPGYAYTPAPAGPQQGLSLASMITGIAAAVLSFFGLGFLPAAAGVVLGHIGQRRQPYARPFWLTGLITSYAALGISLIWGIFLLVVFIVAIASAARGY